MPSVGMRRSSRVFGACVLRSGRRLWTEPHEANSNARTDHTKNQWAYLLEDSGGSCKETRHENESNTLEDVRMEESLPEVVEARNIDLMYGIVYTRKRKRDGSGKMGSVEDRRFGKKFYRRQWRKKSRASSCEICVNSVSSGFRDIAIVANGPPCEYGYWVTCLLATILSYMTRGRVGMRRLSNFLVSKPILNAYSSCGVLFLQDSTTAKNPVICIISRSKYLSPLFSFNFITIPSFFMHMQTSMYLRSQNSFPFLLLANLFDYETDENDRGVYFDKTEDTQQCIQIPCIEHQDFIAVEELQVLSGRQELFSQLSLGVTKSSLRSFQSRNSRHIQKRRSSLRRKSSRLPSGFRAQKTIGTLAAGFLRIRQESAPLSSITKNTKDLKFTFTQDILTNGCSVNLLITELDRCYREEGATITLETSPSKQWFLSIRKDGGKRYGFSAEKVIRPSFTNRLSHATIWAVDSQFKLEFFDRRDWLIFKELYKECYDRNILSPAASVIPIPCVQEVMELFSMGSKEYVRPTSYITVKDDELTRALLKKSANYDMDSDDELWLEKLNDELCEGVDAGTCVTPDSFELIVDAFEKGVHCHPEQNFEERAFCEFCTHLESREVVEAVHSYWVKKRKQKRAALVKIFQMHQPRRIQVIPKLVLRKKRSFKRQASHAGRGKQRPIFHAIVAEREAFEQQNNVNKVQEAKAAAGRFEGWAILKRQKAQMLMANADLATYKATMALRIAEGAEVVES